MALSGWIVRGDLRESELMGTQRKVLVVRLRRKTNISYVNRSLVRSVCLFEW